MLSKYSVKKPYTVLVVLIIVLILGGVAFTSMTIDFLPNIELPYMVVLTVSPGSAPETVESDITSPIENAIASVDNIKSVNSSSMEHVSMVIIEFSGSVDLTKATQDIQTAISMIESKFPSMAMDPYILNVNPSMLPIMSIALYEEGANIAESSAYLEEVSNKLQSVEGVSTVSTSGLVEDMLFLHMTDEKANGIIAIDNLMKKLENGEIYIDNKPITTMDLFSAIDLTAVNNKLNELGIDKSIFDLFTEYMAGNEAVLEPIKEWLLSADESELLTLFKAEELEAKPQIKGFVKLLASIGALGTTMIPGVGEGSSGGNMLDVTSFITADLMGTLIMAQNMSMPAGTVHESNGSFIAKVGDEIKSKEELEKLPLFTLDVGTMLVPSILENMGLTGNTLTPEQQEQKAAIEALGVLKVMLTVDDLYETIELDNSGSLHTLVNGSSGIMVSVNKQPGMSTAEVSSDVKELLGSMQKDNPNLKYLLLMDQGEYVNLLVDTVLKSLLLGALFAIIILFLFLKAVKPTLIVGASIFISLLVALLLMYFSNISINIMSMSGLALGVGMLVDNSIVVLENIYRRKALGEDIKTAAIKGSKQISGAIIASTLTTIVVFLPILFLEGITKQLFRDIALTITYSLVASLLVALTIVPLGTTIIKDKSVNKVNKSFVKVQDFYGKLIGKALNRKWITVTVVVVLFTSTMVGAFFMNREFMPETSMGYLSFSIDVKQENLPEDVKVEDAIELLMDDVYETSKTYDWISDVGMTVSSGGIMDVSSMLGGQGSKISVYAVLAKDCKLSDKEALKQLTEGIKANITNLDKEAYEFSSDDISANMLSMSTNDVTVRISGDDLDKMRQTARDLATKIGESEYIATNVNGKKMINDGVGVPPDEYNIKVDKSKASLYGFTVAQVLLGLQSKLATVSEATKITYEETAHTYSVYVYGNEYDIVRYYRCYDIDGNSEKVYIKTVNGIDTYTINDEEAILDSDVNGTYFKVGEKTYTTKGKDLIEYYTANKNIDLVTTLVSNAMSSEMAGGSSSSTSSIMPTQIVPLYKLLSDESFAKDESGNILYRKNQDGNFILDSDGDKIPESIAFKEGYLSIAHVEGTRIISVSMTLTGGSQKGAKAIQSIVDQFEAPAGVKIEFTGQSEIITDAYTTTLIMLVLAILLIYLVMVAQFQSLKTPAIIMITVPLALTGSVLSLWIAGLDITINALVGVVILLGIVVNNGIVFVDYANQLIREGMERHAALIKTGKDRIRPMLMTALTTIAGLLALALDFSKEGAMTRPMAITTMGGLIYATLLTLFFVPVVYDVFNKKKGNVADADGFGGITDLSAPTVVLSDAGDEISKLPTTMPSNNENEAR